jgi:hypothetical protein
MVKAITDIFDDFSTKRADLIAVTESADAYNAGRFQIASDLGFDEKSWETESGNPCEDCLGNEAESWVDIDADFSGGVDAPTQHPACQCVLNFRKSSASEENEEE